MRYYNVKKRNKEGDGMICKISLRNNFTCVCDARLIVIERSRSILKEKGYNHFYNSFISITERCNI